MTIQVRKRHTDVGCIPLFTASIFIMRVRYVIDFKHSQWISEPVM